MTATTTTPNAPPADGTTQAPASGAKAPAHGPQTTDANGLITETVTEPTLGSVITVRELLVKDTQALLTKATEDNQHRGMALLSVAMLVDGKRVTVEEMGNMPSRKLGAIMRATSVALRLNGLADDETAKYATPEEAAKNG
jgi:hypothetical protein